MSKEKSFGSKEKLKSRKAIQSLFEQGKSIKEYPLILVYQKVTESDFPLKIGFSVSKKNFKRAVDRNRVKRLLREAYRLNKFKCIDTFQNKTISTNAMIIYSSNEILPFEKMEAKVIKLLEKLNKSI